MSSFIFLIFILHPTEQKLHIVSKSSLGRVPRTLNGYFSLIAPVGQASTQFPQDIQFVSESALSIAGLITVLNPRLTNPSADTFNTSEHVCTHLPQLIHLFGSRTMKGCLLSIAYFFVSPLYPSIL